jgi:phage tail protein X
MQRYDDSTILTTNNYRPYFKGRYYPNIPLLETDIYVITTVGDRLDSLAYTYYGDPTLWWVIAMANNNITKGALYPQPGTQLRIPLDINFATELFKQFNGAR